MRLHLAGIGVVAVLFGVLCVQSHELPCIPCQNGGLCNRTLHTQAFNDTYGTCACPMGFGGFGCEVDLSATCTPSCLNNGTCVNGVCQCEAPYSGPQCASIGCANQVTGTGPYNVAAPLANGSCGACLPGYEGNRCELNTACPGQHAHRDSVIAGHIFTRQCEGRSDDASWRSLIQGETLVSMQCSKPSGWLENKTEDGRCLIHFFRTGVISRNNEEIFSCDWRQCRQIVQRVDRMANPSYDGNASDVSEHPVALTIRVLIATATVALGAVVVLHARVPRPHLVMGACIAALSVLVVLYACVAVPLNSDRNSQTIQRTFTDGVPRPVSRIECAETTCRCNFGARDEPNCDLGAFSDIIGSLGGRTTFECDNITDVCSFRNELLFNGGFSIALQCATSQCLDGWPIIPVPEAVVGTGDGASRAEAAAFGGVVGAVLFVVAIAGVVYTVVGWRGRRDCAVSAPAISGLRLTCRDLGYIVGEREILRSITASFPSGAATAVMGPSGAGKTTLLDILAGKAKTGVVTGTVFFGGAEYTHTLRRSVAYVADYPTLMPTFTVREALAASARLQIPAVTSDAEISRLAETAVSQFRLDAVVDSFVSALSAGELKRAHIAAATVGQPLLLLLDEPTSGLDAFSARCVVQCLKDYAATGDVGATPPVVAMTIHQPSESVFRLFDHVLLLSGGRAVYHGTPLTIAGDLISGHEHEIVAQTPAEAALEVAANWPPGKDAVEATKPVVVDELPPEDHADAIVALSAERSRVGLIAVEQCGLLISRAWLHHTRKPGILALQFVISSLVAFGITAMYGDLAKDLPGVVGRAGLIAFNCLWVALVNLSVIEVIASERSTVEAERHAGLYRSGAYVVSKLIDDVLLLRVLPSIVAACISYFAVGLRQDASGFFGYVGLQIVFSVTMTFLATALAASTRSFGVASLAYGFIVVFYFAFGGFVSSRDSLPDGLAWLLYASPFFLILEPLMINELDGLLCTFTPRDETGAPSTRTITLSCDQYLLNLGLHPKYLGTDVGCLIAWCLFFAVAAVAMVMRGVPPAR